MIVGVAIKAGDVIYQLPEPNRHHHVVGVMAELGATSAITSGIVIAVGIQGFVLDDGTFLDRIEAADYAIKCGQIERLQWPPNLYSEDLW